MHLNVSTGLQEKPCKNVQILQELLPVRNFWAFNKEKKWDSMNKQTYNQPEEISTEKQLSTEIVDADQRRDVKERNLTANPGDRISDEPQTIEEKAQQIAVDVPDITGDHVKVPTYFIVDEPDGEQKALHHVKDAEEISDVIRQARVDEDGNRVWW